MGNTLVLLSLIGSTAFAPAPNCTIVTTGDVYVKEPTETWIVGSVLPDTIESPAGDRETVSNIRSGRGQAILVESVSGAGAGSPISLGDTIAVFVWRLGADCSRSARAVLAVGSRHHFEVTLRPDSAWIQALPTLDVDAVSGLRVFPGEQASPISVEDYTAFVSLIPTRAEWDVDCRPSVQRTNAWITAHVYGSPPIRPFGSVAEGLVAACEGSIQQKGNALLRHGVPALPSHVASWAAREDCTIESAGSGGGLRAIPGRFLPDAADDQWAVMCSTNGGWRLVILDAHEGRVLAELSRSVGNPGHRALSVGPPEFFEWASLHDPSQRDESLPPPDFDTVLLDEYGYFWRGNAWRSAWYECCYFTY